MGGVLGNIEDFEWSLNYFKQALGVKKKVLRKTHPDTLTTIMIMAVAYMDGTKDFTKAEEMFRLALDGREKSLGKDHERTQERAFNLAVLYFQDIPSRRKLTWLITKYPHLLQDPAGGELFKNFI